jgi:hypothetical protein
MKGNNYRHFIVSIVLTGGGGDGVVPKVSIIVGKTFLLS